MAPNEAQKSGSPDFTVVPLSPTLPSTTAQHGSGWGRQRGFNDQIWVNIFKEWK